MNDEQMINTDVSQQSDAPVVNRRRLIKVIIVAIIVFAVGIFASKLMFITGIINPYEADYVDVTGRTALDIARDKGMEFDEFLKAYGLPEDMPKRTSERAVYYNVPVGKLVEKNASLGSFEELKESMGWDDTVTESTTMGEALDKTKLSYYVGDEQLQRFKSLYELPETVTGDTLYGEVRNIIDAKDKEFYEADKLKESAEQESE